MSRETALWDRLRDTAIPALVQAGHRVHAGRLENLVGTGWPDVEACIDGISVWIELKSEARPKRRDTPIRPKLRTSQSEWHKTRASVGFRHNWVLLQVGSSRAARLYLLPGDRYDDIKAVTEAELTELSVVPPTATAADVLARCIRGW